jgi:O-antigen ligase
MVLAAQILVALYMTALYISVAGMEMLAWSISLFTLIYILVKKKKFLLPPKLPLYAALAFWGIALVSLVVNEVPSPFFLRAATKFRWVFLFIFFYNFLVYFFNDRFFKKLFVWIDIVILIVAVYCIYQFIYGVDLFRSYSITFRPLTQDSIFFRPNGFFSLTLTLTYSISMYFCVSLARLLHMWEKPFRVHLLHISALVASLLIIFMSFTRGGWMALIITIPVLLVCYKRSVIKYFVGIAAVLFGTLWFSFADFRGKILSFSDLTYVNNVERLNLWKAHWQVAKENPWFGLGYLENSRKIPEYLEKIGHPGSYASHAHNNFLDFLAGTGVFGLIAFVVFIFSVLFYSIKAYRRAKHGDTHEISKALLLGGIGAQLIMHLGGLTECTFKDAELNHQFIFMVSFIFALDYIRANKARPA